MFNTHHELERYCQDRQQEAIKAAEHYRLVKNLKSQLHSAPLLPLRSQLGRWMVGIGTRLQDHSPALKPQSSLDRLHY
jgi:hypothetical protein